jgi:hypothetical protein
MHWWVVTVEVLLRTMVEVAVVAATVVAAAVHLHQTGEVEVEVVPTL